MICDNSYTLITIKGENILANPNMLVRGDKKYSFFSLSVQRLQTPSVHFLHVYNIDI